VDRILIVRLGAMGDIIHALPALAAIRAHYPAARIDWLVEARHRAIVELVEGLDRRIVWQWGHAGQWGRVARVVAELRRNHYDAAFDFQGLLKSAVFARASGAGRVIGFAAGALRERAARPFYSEAYAPASGGHVIEKNLELVRGAGIHAADVRFPLRVPDSTVPAQIRSTLAIGPSGHFALVNPGAAWPNKRWSPERFGAVAAALHQRHGLRAAVLWGPGEEPIARQVAEASAGAAVPAPATSVEDLVAAIAAAKVIVSGDTGPLHIATALGIPTVGIFGPTDPRRNGPWSRDDISISRFDRCACHHKRRCRNDRWCLGDVAAEETIDALDRRLGALATHA
jgi:lipopolysaccharide heptosyltransferase I